MMGRPAIGRRIDVRLPGDLRARAELVAARLGITVAELIRRALAEYLDREGQT